ncbi:hypothetical protein MBANPS3_006372 [Mucor bainieri]
MSFTPHNNNNNMHEEYSNAPFVPANIDKQNSLELAHIQHQLALMQRSYQQQRTTTFTPTTTMYQSQQQLPDYSSKDRYVFPPHQLNALTNQIMAYKLIMQNKPIPPELEQAVLALLAPSHSLLAQSSPPITPIITPKTVYDYHQPPPPPHQGHPHSVPPTPPTSQYHPEEQGTYSSSPAASVPSQSNTLSSPVADSPPYNAYLPPTALLERTTTSHAHATRHQKTLVPSLLPVGLDPRAICSNREKRMLARMKQQQQQQQQQQPTTTLQGHIQSRAIKLYQKQRQLRSELVQGVETSTVLATAAHDRTTFRRTKKVSRMASLQVEAVEQQQRRNQAEAMEAAKYSHLHAICQHSAAVSHLNAQKRAKRVELGVAVLHHHQHAEKTEQKRTERIARERMQALKNNDEEAYLKLLDQAKDTRLTDLLKQTDVFLQSLTKSVVEQQQQQQYDASDSADYFRMAHRIQETVEQPSMMTGGTLKEYQIKGLQWMVSLYNNNLNGILADEMGLGKTIQTISLITYLIETKQQHGPFLIIVPLSTLTNWTLELTKWAPSVSTIVYTGRPQTRKELASRVRSGQFQVLLTTFEYIIRDTQALCRTKWLYLIMDEGHRLKNANAKLTVTLRRKFHARYRLILTGTPLQNSLPELWSLLNFILPRIFQSVKTFEEWFNTPFASQGGPDRVALSEEEQLLIIKRLHKVLRRLKSDVESELPDKVERVIKCKLSALQTTLYQQLKHSRALGLTASTQQQQQYSPSTAVTRLNNILMQLRKVCNHPFVFDGVESALNPKGKSNALLYRCSGKFELLDRMLPKLHRTGHRVLIFFQMTSIMNIMEDYLHWRHYRYLRLDGNTRAENRASLLHHFNAPESPYFVFLLSTRAGGLGLNLQTADTVILFDSDWNPHQDLQAQDRAHRIGQTKQVRIFRLVTSNSIEERILATAQHKLDMDGKVIQAGKFDNRSTEADREALLRSLLLDDKSHLATDDENDENGDDDGWDVDASNHELNHLLKRSDHELRVFEAIDSETRAQQGHQERLIQAHELPAVFDEPDHGLVQDPTTTTTTTAAAAAVVASPNVDRSRRAKQNIKYDDGLTDAQFMRAIQQAEQPASTKSKTNKNRPVPAVITTTTSRKRIKVEPEKTPQVDTVSRLVRKQLTEIFEACYKRVEQSIVFEKEEEEGEEGGEQVYYRKRCELFMDLVDKRDYPDYYTLIKRPISMNMIKQRIHSFYYENIDEFRSDFAVMFDNARIFNEEGSAVYDDANEMEKLLNDELERQCPHGILPAYRKRKTAIEQDFVEDPFEEDEY